jgi:hypothetical protein
MFNRRRVRSREENGTTSAVNRTIFKYNATSGDGIFRRSYVPEFPNELQRANPSHAAIIVSYSAMIRASQLITHPAHPATMQPINCHDPRLCDSYLLPGGPAPLPPWPPTDYTDYLIRLSLCTAQPPPSLTLRELQTGSKALSTQQIA